MLNASPKTPAPVDFKQLLKWSYFFLRQSFWPFLAALALTVIIGLLSQFSVQVLSSVTSGLASLAASAAGSKAVAENGGIIGALIPTDIGLAVYLFAVLSVSVILLNVANRFLRSWSDGVMLTRLQNTLHSKILRMDAGFHGKTDAAELGMIVMQFSKPAQTFLADVLAFPITRGVSLITAFYFLGHNLGQMNGSPVVMAGLYGTLIFLPVVSTVLLRFTRDTYRQKMDADRELNVEFGKTAAAPLEFQLMVAEEARNKRFSISTHKAMQISLTAVFRGELLNQFQAAVPLILQTSFLIYAVYLAMHMEHPATAIGSILAVYAFVPAAVQPIHDIIAFLTGVQSVWPMVSRVLDILDAEPTVKEPLSPQQLPSDHLSLKLDKTSFGYGGNPILAGLSHEFMRGKTTAIVGRSGCGKSTILNLLVRQNDPDSGSILAGDTDLRNVQMGELRHRIVKVSQFPYILPDSVRENFQLVKPDASDHEIEDICIKTGIWETLSKLAGSDNVLDRLIPQQTGQGLSGGQRKLFTLTRALLVNPDVLILDEPTSGVDSISRLSIVNILNTQCPNTTIIIVDHDMGFVKQISDVVCCLEAGQFQDVGSPDELLSRKTLFRSLSETETKVSSVGNMEIQSVPLPLSATKATKTG